MSDLARALPDTRRVCDLTAAEMLAIVLASLEMDAGEWEVTIRATGGRPRRLKGVLQAAPYGTTFGHDELAAIRL